MDYLSRHPEIEGLLTRSGTRRYLTTDLTPRFAQLASLFMGQHLKLGSGGVVIPFPVFGFSFFAECGLCVEKFQ